MSSEQRNLYPPMELLLVGAAVRVGLFEALRAGSLAEDILAARINADAGSLWVVIEALVESGYLRREGDAVNLTPMARDMFYNPAGDRYTGFSFMHGYELCRSWLSLPDILRNGRPVERKKTDDDIRSFISSMALHARKVAPVVVRDCLEGMPAEPAVLDAGGGPLTYAREFAALGAKVTVLDLPKVVEMVKPTLKAGEKIELVPGDMTRNLPEGPFDLAYLGNVCHIFDQYDNRKLFARTYRVLRPGGRIAVQDFVRGSSPRAAMFGVNMLVNTPGGGTWTLEQYEAWLTEAGFKDVKMKNYGERQLITAQKMC